MVACNHGFEEVRVFDLVWVCPRQHKQDSAYHVVQLHHCPDLLESLHYLCASDSVPVSHVGLISSKPGSIQCYYWPELSELQPMIVQHAWGDGVQGV